MRKQLFEEWSTDPVERQRQIDSVVSKRRPSWELAPKKRKPTKAWEVKPEQRFWERSAFEERYVQSLPRWVQCAEDFKRTKESFRCRREVAVEYRHVQQNSTFRITSLSVDIDAHNGVEVCLSKGPRPNFICENPENGHVHATWMLWKALYGYNPVETQQFLSIERAIKRRLDGDIAFSNTGLCKNPLHDYWHVTHVRDKPYDLAELFDAFTPKEMKRWSKKEKQTGFGRNCRVFDELGLYARQVVVGLKMKGWCRQDFTSHIEETAWAMNLDAGFIVPLHLAEVREIAGKVARWTWQYFSEDGLRRWHSMKGRAGMRVRWAGHVTAEEKAKELGISRATYYRRLAQEGSLHSSPRI